MELLLQRKILETGLLAMVDTWAPLDAPLLERARAELAKHRDASAHGLRMAYALVLLWSDRLEELDEVLAPFFVESDGDDAQQVMAATWQAKADAVVAATMSRRGQWAASEAVFDAALQALRKVTGKRRDLLPDLLALPYVQALLAQQSPGHLQKALKFCLTESGKKEGSPDTPYGVMALAMEMRRGDVITNLTRFKPLSTPAHPYRIDLWRWLMRAWLSSDATALPLTEPEVQAAQRLQTLFSSLGLHGLAAQIEGALAVLQGRGAGERFFVPSEQEGWRMALAALANLGTSESVINTPDPERTRLLWVLSVSDQGRVLDILPHEQTLGARGWGKPKEIALARLAKMESLRPADALVAGAVR
ncbi:MAG: hypothetical protein V4532_00760, partial [Pseudomonadota bacterium]